MSRPNSKISNQGAFMTERVDDHHDDEISVNLFNDRVDLANKITVIEQAMADEHYTPSGMNEDVLPTVASEMNPGIKSRNKITPLGSNFTHILLSCLSIFVQASMWDHAQLAFKG